jgi:hypothetical protein
VPEVNHNGLAAAANKVKVSRATRTLIIGIRIVEKRCRRDVDAGPRGTPKGAWSF